MRAWRRRRFWVVRAVAAVLTVGAAAVAAPTFAAPPDAPAYTQAFFRSSDGTLLHADVFRPAGDTDADRTPVLLEIGPYDGHAKGTGSAPPVTAQPVYELAEQHELWRHGYSVVYVDMRGFGGSAGCFDELGPLTAKDVAAAVRWAATRSWSTGKVAVIGGSMTGASGVMALATHPRGLAAVVTFSPIVSNYREFFSDEVPYYQRGLWDLLYWTEYSAPGAPTDDPQYQLNWAQHHAQPGCDAAVAAGNVTSDPNAAYWRERDYLAAAARSDVPVFGGQGFLEFNVPTDQGLSLFPRLSNLQGLWLAQLPHEFFPVETAQRVGLSGAGDQIVRFLDHTLRGAPAPEEPPVVVQQAPDLTWRTEQQWPPADARLTWLPLRRGSYSDTGLNADGDVSDYGNPFFIPTNEGPVTGDGAWTFTQPLPYAVHLAGQPQVDVQVTGPATGRLFALLYDVSPDGTAYLICRGGTVLGNGHLQLSLAPQDWRVAAGHRLGLLLSGGDVTAFPPAGSSGQTVIVQGGALGLPALLAARTSNLAGGPGGGWAEEKRSIQIAAATIGANSEQAPLPPKPTDGAHRVR